MGQSARYVWEVGIHRRLTMTEAEQRELLLSYKSWLHGTAIALLQGRPDHLITDLEQIGLIAMWEAIELNEIRQVETKAPLDWWLKRQALFAMNRTIRDWFEPMKQRQHTWVDDVTRYVDLPMLLPGVEMAYHRGEIYQALSELSPKEREYVMLRFWQGQRTPELREHFGYYPSTLWATARKKLQKSLAHLSV
jgi:DNA-directed RNA polymerase specialized sigma24 family protein